MLLLDYGFTSEELTMMLKVCPDCFGTNGGHHLCCPNNDGETEYNPEEYCYDYGEPDQYYLEQDRGE